VKITGVTVHFVDEHYDNGQIIVQEKVVVLAEDKPETLARRVLEVEHRLYPDVVRAICNEEIFIKNGKTVWQR
jgi:phosphoribosylglycinamide formyltransferase-1